MSQTLRAIGGAGHGPANAAMLPHTIPALERRFPGRVDPDGSLTALAERLARLAHADGIRKIGVSEDRLQACAQAAARRVADLEGTPPPADADELLEIYRAAW
jgi:alcohol dehydrogenase class IV